MLFKNTSLKKCLKAERWNDLIQEDKGTRAPSDIRRYYKPLTLSDSADRDPLSAILWVVFLIREFKAFFNSAAQLKKLKLWISQYGCVFVCFT